LDSIPNNIDNNLFDEIVNDIKANSLSDSYDRFSNSKLYTEMESFFKNNGDFNLFKFIKFGFH
jgi:hypothetical protein